MRRGWNGLVVVPANLGVNRTTSPVQPLYPPMRRCFQFLGIPPKGELPRYAPNYKIMPVIRFPISRDPPEGGTAY